ATNRRRSFRGTRADGSRMMPFPMDWASFSTLTPQDLDALIAYLRTVPPVSNRIPSHRQPLLPFYLWGKVKLLMLGDAPRSPSSPATPAQEEVSDEAVPARTWGLLVAGPCGQSRSAL